MMINVVKHAKIPFENVHGEIVCKKCGNLNGFLTLEERIENNVSYINMYKKETYFYMFLRKIQGLTALRKQHQEHIKELFQNHKKPVTTGTIRKTLTKNKLIQKYFRYVPEIWYLLNDERPMLIKPHIENTMISIYREIVNYEKKNKLNLRSSKRHFIHYCLKDSTYDIFLPQRCIPEKYTEIFDSFFKS